MASKLAGLDADYKAWYNKGWRYSLQGSGGLDYGDSLNAPEAWYDGYLDAAAAREKWHLAFCRQNKFAGCAEHDTRGVPVNVVWPPEPPVAPMEVHSLIIALIPPKNPHSASARDRRWLVNEANPKLGRGVITELFATSASDPAGAQAEANKVLGHDYTWVPKGHGFQAVLS